ncbi:MAG: hypothetical protein WBG42_08605, partial [Cryomorphaceae bacterium]
MRALRFIFLFLLIGSALTAWSSEPEIIESLKSELNENSTAEDEMRIFNDLAWEYTTSNFDSASHYVDLALTLAEAEKSIFWRAVSM